MHVPKVIKPVGHLFALVLAVVEVIFFTVAVLGAVFWISAEYNVGNSRMLLSLLTSA